MDERFIQTLTLGLNSPAGRSMFDVVSGTINEVVPTLAVRDARDAFTKVLREVRSGQLKVIGDTPDQQVVIISAKDLSIVVEAIYESRSFMDVLRMDPMYDPPDVNIEFTERPRSRENIGPQGLTDHIDQESRQPPEPA